jgi:hypothetical protein
LKAFSRRLVIRVDSRFVSPAKEYDTEAAPNFSAFAEGSCADIPDASFGARPMAPDQRRE